MIFIPSLVDLFFYVPDSLADFLEFITEYEQDRKQGKIVTTAPPSMLVGSLRKTFSDKLYEVAPFEMLTYLLQSFYQEEDTRGFSLCYRYARLATKYFTPKEQAALAVELKSLVIDLPELFIGITEEAECVTQQWQHGLNKFYKLKAFIEKKVVQEDIEYRDCCELGIF